MTEEKQEPYGLFMMPRRSDEWKGSEALWITVAGWASAAKRIWPGTLVMTTDRTAEPFEVYNYPLSGPADAGGPRDKTMVRMLPSLLKQFLKDGKRWLSSSRNQRLPIDQLPEGKPLFIWEQHDIFPGPGLKLARSLGIPHLYYVHAPQVWEARKWGVGRPVWGRLIEKYVEARNLRQSDLVACVSVEVAGKLREMGVAARKILVAPMAADPHIFKLNANSRHIRERYNLGSAQIIGWVGSFRSFHGLDHLVKAFALFHARVGDTKLLLVGDGQERADIEALVSEEGLEDAVIFAGRQPFTGVADFVSAFDVAVVSARSSEGFHYSPLKLREYLAAGKGTLAPRAGEIPKVFTEDRHLMLFETGNIEDIAAKLERLVNDVPRREELAISGRNFILENGTWDVELRKALSCLDIPIPEPSVANE